jgi:hypothetical protein
MPVYSYDVCAASARVGLLKSALTGTRDAPESGMRADRTETLNVHSSA